MAHKLDTSAYVTLLRVRQARRFDVGCFAMRLFAYMMNIGTMAMLTLAGYSFSMAGIASSIIAASTFIISPRVSKAIDERGQSAIVPRAAAIAMAGTAIMLATVWFNGPVWLLFAAALLIGFLPNPQALARARWVSLIYSGRLGESAPSLTTMFSYEGVLDDIGFMFGPSISIALASSIAPAVGMLAGAVAYILGLFVLLSSRDTEPSSGGIEKKGVDIKDDPDVASAPRDSSKVDGLPSARNGKKPHPIIVSTPVVVVLFFVMLFVGAFFSSYDAGTIALAEGVGEPSLASYVLMLVSFLSMFTGILFGMLRIKGSVTCQLLVTSLLAGGSFGCMFLVDSAGALFAISTIAALFYAPLLITTNSVCERTVETSRITEAITWINAGMTCGMAIGPSLSGFIIDTFGYQAGFDICAILAWAVPAIVLVCIPVLRRASKTHAFGHDAH